MNIVQQKSIKLWDKTLIKSITIWIQSTFKILVKCVPGAGVVGGGGISI